MIAQLRAALLASAALTLASSTFAQTGPWADGELLVQSVNSGNGASVLYRIDPTTGHGVELLSGFAWGSTWGRLTFDTYRGGFVGCFSIAPSSPGYKIQLIRHDGSRQHLPGFEGKMLDAFCSAGDGRIFFQEHSMTGVGPWYIRYLDAQGAIHTLMDASGTAPLDFQVEHMVWHAPTNSLIATTSPWWSTHHCVASGPSAFRIPLSVDGTKVAGVIDCASFLTNVHEVMSMDYLPNGNLLVTTSTGSIGAINRLGELNPVTLAFTVWGNPGPIDLNGGLWCSALGKAIVLGDAPDELLAYSAGQSGGGSQILTDVSLNNGSSGFSPGESIWETKLTGGDGNYCTPHVNSTGAAAHMSFVGSKSISQNALTLQASPVPNSPFLFLCAPAKAALPFGNGTLCLGGGVHRVQPGGVSSGQLASVSPNLGALGITPGTWQFQCWF
ncbi:MAG TPA: hypothetical protein VK843_17710, partial [Planctomycetota bacterium]|nr:hypothetical protein [Planctomycetota bacterium]